MKKKLRNHFVVTILVMASCVFPTLTRAGIIYVRIGASGANNGSSWMDAYTSLSSALATAAAGDEVWVAQGVYKPSTVVDLNASGGVDAREATFQVPTGVALYGGFAGTESMRDERNWLTNLTILSGDIDNNDINGDGNSIAETSSDIVGNNAYHVLYTLNVSTATRVDGFVITAGKAQFAGNINDVDSDGGGWYNRMTAAGNSSPTIQNNLFQGNYCESDGAALFNLNGPAGAAVTSLVQDCRFINNRSNTNGGAIYLGSFSAGNYSMHLLECEFTGNQALRRGGALYFIGDHAVIDTCTFDNNSVTVISPNGSTLPGSGGAAAMTASNAIYNYCQFTGNSATGNPTGAFEGGGGGAVYMSANEIQTNDLGISNPTFTGCGFYNNISSGNTTSWGGAAAHLSDAGKLRPKYVNCVFAANTAQNSGGAIANFARVISAGAGFVPFLDPSFTNCTFVGNHANTGGGAIYNDGYVYTSEILHCSIVNSILWDDTAPASAEVSNNAFNNVSYSLIEGSGGSGGGWVAAIGTDGGHNIATNPQFVTIGDPDGADNAGGTNDDGLRLGASSPAANAGNNAAAGLAGITVDYILATRVLGGTVDMGAYERSGVVVPQLPIKWLRDWRPYNPPCLVCPWAFVFLNDIYKQMIWDGPAQLIDNGDYAIITGRIIVPRVRNSGFEVYIKLINKQDWAAWSAKGRGYTAISLEAIVTAIRTHKSWTFWEMSRDSYLQGFGDISGKLALTSNPANNKTGFQFGTGANGWDKDPGMSGGFAFKGTLVVKGKKVAAQGTGNMNVDAETCVKNCEPLIDDGGPRLRAIDQQPVASTDANSFDVYPVPARDRITVTLPSPNAAGTTLRLYNSIGQLALQKIARSKVEEIDLGGLKPGVYFLQASNSSGELMNKRIVIR